MDKHVKSNPESSLLRRKAEDLLKMKKAEPHNISRPYGTLGNRGANYSTYIQSRWDCPAGDNISVENKVELVKSPVGQFC